MPKSQASEHASLARQQHHRADIDARVESREKKSRPGFKVNNNRFCVSQSQHETFQWTNSGLFILSKTFYLTSVRTDENIWKTKQKNFLCSNGFHTLRYFSLFCFLIIKLERQFSVLAELSSVVLELLFCSLALSNNYILVIIIVFIYTRWKNWRHLYNCCGRLLQVL